MSKSANCDIGRKVSYTKGHKTVYGTAVRLKEDKMFIVLNGDEDASLFETFDQERRTICVPKSDISWRDSKPNFSHLIGQSIVFGKESGRFKGRVLKYIDSFLHVQLSPDEKQKPSPPIKPIDEEKRIYGIHPSKINEIISNPNERDDFIGQKVICTIQSQKYSGTVASKGFNSYFIILDDKENVQVPCQTSKNNEKIVEVPRDMVVLDELTDDLVGVSVTCQKSNRSFRGTVMSRRNDMYMVQVKKEDTLPKSSYFDVGKKLILVAKEEISSVSGGENIDSSKSQSDQFAEKNSEIDLNAEVADNINYLMALCDIYRHGHSSLALTRGTIITVKDIKAMDNNFCRIQYILHEIVQEICVPQSRMQNNFAELSDDEYFILFPIKPDRDRIHFYENGGLDLCKLLTVGTNALVTSKLLGRKTECIIRYKGFVDSRPGTWFGVELMDSLSMGEDKSGHCDGKQYFQTNRKSLFVTANQLFENSKAPLLSFKEGDIVKWKSKDLESAVDIGCITSIDVRPGNSAAVIDILGMYEPMLGFVERDNAEDALRKTVVPLHGLESGLNLLPKFDTVIGRTALLKLDPKSEPIHCTILDVHSSSQVIIETEISVNLDYISRCQQVKDTRVYGPGKEHRIVIVPFTLLIVTHVLEYKTTDLSLISEAVKKDLENKNKNIRTGGDQKSIDRILNQKEKDYKNPNNFRPDSPSSTHPTSLNKGKTEIKSLKNQYKNNFETIEFNDVILKDKNLKINDPIIIQMDNATYSARLRWSGIIDKFSCVGVEMDEDVLFGTDGTFQETSLFKCKDKRGILLPLIFVMKNNNIPEEEDEEKSSSPYDSSFYKSLKPVETDDKLNKLTVDSLVTVNLKDNLERQGSVKYIGISDLTDEMLVGVELDYLSSLGNDGVFDGVKLFECNPGCGVLVPLDNVKPDDRFDKAIEAEAKKIPLPEYYDRKYSPEELKQARALSSVKDKSGPFRGIQGCYNSCYMDSTIYAMFAFNSCFDNLINRPNQGDKRIKELQQLLADTIVAPLRCEHHFVNSSMMLEFRSKLETFMTEKRQQSAGFQYEEKDPEEFLNCLFGQLFNCDQFLKFDNSQEGFMYQVFLEEGTLKKENPSTQELLQISLSSNCAKFKQPPSTLILLLPRHGRDYRMFSHVILSPEIDLTYLLTNDKYSYPCGGGKRNFPCDKSAAYQCLECTDAKGFSSELVLCKNCWRTSPHDTKRHKKIDLKTDNSLIDDSPKLELFAVLSIETSHYVAFVKTGKDKNSKWVLFDSMAVRKGEMNVPEVTVIPEISDWLAKPDSIRNLTTKRSVIQKRLFCDTYMCFYRNPDLDIYG